MQFSVSHRRTELENYISDNRHNYLYFMEEKQNIPALPPTPEKKKEEENNFKMYWKSIPTTTSDDDC